jgi:hypothetical protein
MHNSFLELKNGKYIHVERANDRVDYYTQQGSLEELAQWNEILFLLVRRAVMHGNKLVPKRIRVLEAHGATTANDLLYTDQIERRTVYHKTTDWIREHESNYDALYLAVCNEKGLTLPPSKATLVYLGNIGTLTHGLFGPDFKDNTRIRIVPGVKPTHSLLNKPYIQQFSDK